jgi:dTDP-4-amino-4,6-dideoxygalactose transaminase
MISSQKKIWLSSPHMSGREKEFVEEAFTTNWVAPLGPHVDGFEAEILRLILGKDCVCGSIEFRQRGYTSCID